MGAGFRVAIGVVACALATGAVGLCAQSVTLTEPPVQLLPQSFGGWQQGGTSDAGAVSLSTVNKAALQECGPLRSQVNTYTRGGRTMRVEAVEFGDRTGAYSAFTLATRPEMKVAKEVGSSNAVGDGAVLFTIGKFALAIYFKEALPTSAFGAAGAPVAVLLWVYYSAFILFFGAEFTKVYTRRFGSHGAASAPPELPRFTKGPGEGPT